MRLFFILEFIPVLLILFIWTYFLLIEVFPYSFRNGLGRLRQFDLYLLHWAHPFQSFPITLLLSPIIRWHWLFLFNTIGTIIVVSNLFHFVWKGTLDLPPVFNNFPSKETFFFILNHVFSLLLPTIVILIRCGY